MDIVLDAIAKLSWRFAKSMPQWPHYYTVRQRHDPELDAAYMIVHRATMTGRVEIFTGTKQPSAKRYIYIRGTGGAIGQSLKTLGKSPSSTATPSRAPMRFGSWA